MEEKDKNEEQSKKNLAGPTLAAIVIVFVHIQTEPHHTLQNRFKLQDKYP